MEEGTAGSRGRTRTKAVSDELPQAEHRDDHPTADSQAPGVLLSTLILCASAAPRQPVRCTLRTWQSLSSHHPPLVLFFAAKSSLGGGRHHSIRFCRISNPDMVRRPPTAFFTATSLQLRHPGAVPSLFALPPPEYMKALYPLARTRHLLHPDRVADPEPQLLQHSPAPPVPNDRLCPHNPRPHSWNSPQSHEHVQRAAHDPLAMQRHGQIIWGQV